MSVPFNLLKMFLPDSFSPVLTRWLAPPDTGPQIQAFLAQPLLPVLPRILGPILPSLQPLVWLLSLRPCPCPGSPDAPA